jgi:hypothetical protein
MLDERGVGDAADIAEAAAEAALAAMTEQLRAAPAASVEPQATTHGEVAGESDAVGAVAAAPSDVLHLDRDVCPRFAALPFEVHALRTTPEHALTGARCADAPAGCWRSPPRRNGALH